jgi:hypothetical protein
MNGRGSFFAWEALLDGILGLPGLKIETWGTHILGRNKEMHGR